MITYTDKPARQDGWAIQANYGPYIHMSLECAPAMRAGVVHELRNAANIVRTIEIWEKLRQARIRLPSTLYF
jgi:hypothetical protein